MVRFFKQESGYATELNFVVDFSKEKKFTADEIKDKFESGQKRHAQS